MDYAERVLQEVMQKFESMDIDEYEKIYQSAMKKLKQKEDSLSFVRVKTLTRILAKYTKNVNYSEKSNKAKINILYSGSVFERNHECAA